MNRVVATLVGMVAVVAAVLLAVADVPLSAGDPVVITVVSLLAVAAFIGVLVKIAGTADGEANAAAPWTDAGALYTDAPERSPANYDISGQRLAGIVQHAGDASRSEGTVSAGIEVVRPELRHALIAALVQGGVDREAAKRSLARGDWTDDPAAAAVLDETVDHPGWGLLQRFQAWLFPERLVRHEVQQAMQEVAITADDVLPTVPGQHAPRTVPVVRPTLEDLQRGADGHLQRAVDPLGAQSGSSVDGGVRIHDATGVTSEFADDDTSPESEPAETADPDAETGQTGNLATGAGLSPDSPIGMHATSVDSPAGSGADVTEDGERNEEGTR